MGLTQCPDCHRNISESAPACPHCGRPMTAGDSSGRERAWKALQNGEEQERSGLGGCSGCLLVCVVLFGVLAALFSIQGAAFLTTALAFFAAWGVWLVFPVVFVVVLFIAAVKFIFKDLSRINDENDKRLS